MVNAIDMQKKLHGNDADIHIPLSDEQRGLKEPPKPFLSHDNVIHRILLCSRISI
jgi:hypothetical protein